MPLCANCHSRKLTAALRAKCLSKDKIPRLLRTEVTTQQGLAALPAVWCLYRSNVNNWKEKKKKHLQAQKHFCLYCWEFPGKRSLQTTHVVTCSMQAISNSLMLYLGKVTFWYLSISCPPHAVAPKLTKLWLRTGTWVTSWIRTSFGNSFHWCLY